MAHRLRRAKVMAGARDSNNMLAAAHLDGYRGPAWRGRIEMEAPV